jgi:hypothetical protein
MEGFFVAAVFIGIPWVLGNVYRSHLTHVRFMKTLQLKADMSARLLDRLGAEPQVLEFLKSEVQQQMFDVKLAEPADRMPAPFGRMLTAVQAGIVLLSGGLAFLMIRNYMPRHTTEELLLMGSLGVALGIGAILAGVAAVVLGRMWRALEETRA